MMNRHVKKNIYGESNEMQASMDPSQLIFKSKWASKLVLFLILMFVFLFSIELFTFSINYYIYPIYALLAILASLTYRRIIVFQKDVSKITYLVTCLGLKKRRKFSFQDIENIKINITSSPIVGIQLPLPVKKYSLNIFFRNKKRIYVDRSTDITVIKKFAESISNITSLQVIEE